MSKVWKGKELGSSIFGVEMCPFGEDFDSYGQNPFGIHSFVGIFEQRGSNTYIDLSNISCHGEVICSPTKRGAYFSVQCNQCGTKIVNPMNRENSDPFGP